MSGQSVRIAVVAPSTRFAPAAAERVREIAAAMDPAPHITFHPQCFASWGHFAGDDATRATALIEVAESEAFDAVWFARGGYGAGRLIEAALPRLDALIAEGATTVEVKSGYGLALEPDRKSVV